MKVPVSAFIMTLNEENNLRACVDSLRWVDEVVIVDSESSDKTRELAERLGCRVVTKRLVSWSEHQNWVLRNVTFRNEWVLNVDADETIPPDLAEEIRAVVTKNTDTVAYRFRRKDYFLGRWLKHASFIRFGDPVI